eukprot:jgi/Ulvmu1/1847/UM012_0003.1
MGYGALQAEAGTTAANISTAGEAPFRLNLIAHAYAERQWIRSQSVHQRSSSVEHATCGHTALEPIHACSALFARTTYSCSPWPAPSRSMWSSLTTGLLWRCCWLPRDTRQKNENL